MSSKHILKHGSNILSFRALALMERKLVVDNIFRNGTHSIPNLGFFINIEKRDGKTLFVHENFNHKVPINPHSWFIYEYRQQTVDMVYPQLYYWMEIIMPNKHSIMTYLPDIVSAGDTLIVNPNDTLSTRGPV